MLILELTINGKAIARAGRKDLAVLSSCISAVGVLGGKSAGTKKRAGRTHIHVHLGGLTAKKDRTKDVHLNWIRLTKLKVGDEVKVRILEGTKADKPLGKARPVNRSARVKRDRAMFDSAKKYYLKHRSRYERDAV